MTISSVGTSRAWPGSGTAAGAIVYSDENTAGLRSSNNPLAVQGNDAHAANENRIRVTSLVLIGLTCPLRLVNVRAEKSTAKPLGVPLRIVIVDISDVGV